MRPARLNFPSIAIAQFEAERLIGVAAREHPEEIGGPIDVIAIEPKGVRWLRRKAER